MSSYMQSIRLAEMVPASPCTLNYMVVIVIVAIHCICMQCFRAKEDCSIHWLTCFSPQPGKKDTILFSPFFTLRNPLHWFLPGLHSGHLSTSFSSSFYPLTGIHLTFFPLAHDLSLSNLIPSQYFPSGNPCLQANNPPLSVPFLLGFSPSISAPSPLSFERICIRT